MSNGARFIVALALSIASVGVYRKYTAANSAVPNPKGRARAVAPATPTTPTTPAVAPTIPTPEVARATPTPEVARETLTTAPTPSGESDPLLSLKRAAEQVVVSLPDDKESVYIFDENDRAQRKALEDIKRKVEDYSQSPHYLRALSAVAEANDAILEQTCLDGNVRPSLLINVLLLELAAQAAHGQKLNAAGAAGEVMEDLKWHRNRVGTQHPDSCLLVVAQVKAGRDRGKVTRLAARRREVDPFGQRNVWYLHEHGGLDAEAYNLVISFIAAGIVARQPKNFSTNAAPLRFENRRCG